MYDTLIQAFLQLPRSEKIKKLSTILEIFLPYSPTAQQAYALLQEKPDYMEQDEIDQLYEYVIKAAEYIQQKIQIDYLHKVKSILETIHNREEQQRLQENPQTLLQSL